MGDFEGREELVRCGKDSVWVKIEMAATDTGELRLSCTILSRQPLSTEEAAELQHAINEIAERTIETLDQEAPTPEPIGARAVNRVVQPQVGAFPAWLLVPAQSSKASSFAVLANGVDSLANQGHAALMGAVRLFVSPTSPDADAVYVLCQAITLPWDGLLARIATRLRIAGVIFAIASGNPLLLHTCVVGLARTLFARTVSLTVREAIDAMFSHRECITDITIEILSASHQHPGQQQARELRAMPITDAYLAQLGRQAKPGMQTRWAHDHDAITMDHRDEATYDKHPKRVDSIDPTAPEAVSPPREGRAKHRRQSRPREEQYRPSSPESPESAPTGRHEPSQGRAGKARTRAHQAPGPEPGSGEGAPGPHHKPSSPHAMVPGPQVPQPASSEQPVPPDPASASTAEPGWPRPARHRRPVADGPQSSPAIGQSTGSDAARDHAREGTVPPPSREQPEISRVDKPLYIADKPLEAFGKVVEPHVEHKNPLDWSSSHVQIPFDIESLNSSTIDATLEPKDGLSRESPAEGFGISGSM